MRGVASGAFVASSRGNNGFWEARVEVCGSARGMLQSVRGDTGLVVERRMCKQRGGI